MKEYVRCKPCGYVMEKGDLKDVCPACGKDKKFFEPYKHKMSPKRRFILDLDIHPISVHFPQFIVSALPMMIFYHWLFPSYFNQELHIIIKFMSFFFPFTIVFTLITGLYDGKIRFKTLDTPALKQKMVLGMLMLILSVVVYFEGMVNINSLTSEIVIMICCMGGLALAVILGLSGKKLMFSHMPG